MERKSGRLELFLVVLLGLRFSLLYHPFFSGHRYRSIFWIYVLCTDATTVLAARYIWKKRELFHIRLPEKQQMWTWGVGMGFLATLFNVGIRWISHGTRPEFVDAWYLQIIFLPVIQFIVAATAEEPLFRGLLWGYLKLLGRPDWVILLVQSLLFFAAHAYYATPGLYANWFSTLLMGLLFGLSAWKTRSILPSMVAHAVVNGLSQTFLPR